MNRADIDLHSVQYHSPQIQYSSARYSSAASNRALSHSDPEYAGDTESVSNAETVLRRETPPETRQTHEHAQSEATLKPLQPRRQLSRHALGALATSHLDQGRLRAAGGAAAKDRQNTIFQGFDSAPPTPNSDDTPYILYAIDQLTRDRSTKASQRPATETTLGSDGAYPVDRVIPDEGLGYLQPHHGLGRLQSVKKVKGPAVIDIRPASGLTELFSPVEPPLDSLHNPDLTFRPKMLRPLSMIMLLASCLLMVVAMVLCASYSSSNQGLVVYAGGITGAQYFLFQFMPQILAAAIQLYVEAIISAVARILPFTMMASDNTRRRSDALFVGLYSSSLFLPRFDYLASGERLLGVCSLFLWPLSFAIPLQSCLFSVIYVDGLWRWTAVRGVAWTLVAIYTMALISLAGIAIHFSRRVTGLLWDPRSLADIIALISRSNSFIEYHGTEVMTSRSDLQARLAVATPRLGYWRTHNNAQEIFYCIGEAGAPTRKYTVQAGKPQSTPYLSRDIDLEAASPRTVLAQGIRRLSPYGRSASRYQHLPWYLKASRLLLWSVAGFFLLLALLIVSFLPSTALSNGFPPLITAAPNSNGFSPANFLYSFVPSLLGILIYTSFRSSFLMICRLTPWCALSDTKGATASESLLVDYTASFPLLSALGNKHQLVALLSVLTFLNILVPVLAGGLFFAIELLPSQTVVMLPNLPAFYVIIIVLILSFIGLVYVMIHVGSREPSYRLPHPVSCLAEIFSFIYASGIAQDAAFVAVRSKADLRARLVGRRERDRQGFMREEVRYSFGIFRGKDGEIHIGIERLKRENRQSRDHESVLEG